MIRTLTLAAALLAVTLAASPAAAEQPDPEDVITVSGGFTCVPHGDRLLVYGIGSSTMGSILKPELREVVEDAGGTFYAWGKASSGLARPDYHDWPEVVPGVVRKHDPDYFIVSLGTNDGQALMYRSGRSKRKRWAKIGTDGWRERYAERVDAMLEALVGPDKTRPVIWIGPTGHPSARANRKMKQIRDVIRARVEAFDGPVAFIDGLAATLDERTGKPIARVRPEGADHKVKALQRDGMHLTSAGARWLLVEPVLRLLGPCLASDDDDTASKAGD